MKRNFREGEKWFYEVSEVFSRYVNLDNVHYCGFESINIGGYIFTCGVFEFDSSFKFSAEFCKYIENYSSDRILSIRVFDSIARYRHCALVVLK